MINYFQNDIINYLIEGNFQEDLFKSLDNLDYNKPTLELPLDKMSLILEKMYPYKGSTQLRFLKVPDLPIKRSPNSFKMEL